MKVHQLISLLQTMPPYAAVQHVRYIPSIMQVAAYGVVDSALPCAYKSLVYIGTHPVGEPYKDNGERYFD